MLDAVRILTAALIVTGVAQLASAQPVEYDLAIDAAASLSDPGAGGELSTFAPLLYEDDHLLFGDFRAGGIHDEFFNLSFGWGGRRLLPSGWIAGWSAYMGLTEINSDDSFAHSGLGLEWLSIDWDVRINGYLADSAEYSAGPSRAVVRNSAMLIEHPLIGANSGTDFEIGYLLGDWKGGAVEWRGYVGGYYFGRGGVGFEPLTGPRVRTELRLFDLAWLGTQSRIVAAGQYQWDEVRGSQGLVSLFARVTLGTKHSGKLSRIHRRMVNPVVRQPGAVLSRGAWTERALVYSSGQMKPVGVINGRTLNPTARLRRLGENSVVLFSDAAGPIEVSETFELQNGQIVVGGPGTLPVVGEHSGMLAAFGIAGLRPQVRGTNPDRDVFRLADNSSGIFGLNIDGGRNGIAGSGSERFAIVDNSITGAVYSSNPAVRDMSGNGILLDAPGSLGGRIEDNFVNYNHVGIRIAGDFAGPLSGNQTNHNVHSGVRIDGELYGDLQQHESSHNGVNGIHVRGSVHGRLDDNTASGNGGSGVRIEGSALQTVARNMLVDNGGYGLLIEGDVKRDLDENSAISNGAWGIFVGDTHNRVHRNTADDNDGGGIRIGYSHWRVEKNTARRNGLDGILVHGSEDHIMDNTSSWNGHRRIDGARAGLHVIGRLNGKVLRNQVQYNHGPGVLLELTSTRTIRATSNVMEGNNDGGSEFVAGTASGAIGTVGVTLTNNISRNVVPAGTYNFLRLDPQIVFRDGWGNFGSIDL